MSQAGGEASSARDSLVEQVASSVISQLQQQQHQQQQHQQQQQQYQQKYEANPEDEEVMVATERDLAEDAQWKRIQQNTFTRWANEHLKTVDLYIGNLETDLSDGLKLIALIEVLSGKKLPKHNKKPTFRSQKLENVSVALRFLEHDEGIRIVNIDSSDIVDCKLKLILGLIWTLILHYSISMPMWDGDDGSKDGKGPTPKQRLMGWIQSKIPELPISNFTSDWNDGRAVGALVDAVAPGLCPDWCDWDPKDALQNATEAMTLADDWLRIPQLVKPEEMVNPNVDELSMMTYLSQYPNAKLQPNAPLRPKANPNSPAPPRVRAYGPGVEPTGPVVGAPANFTVETFSAGKGDVEVVVQDARGQIIPSECKFNNDRNLSYACSYTPQTEGVHRVVVRFNGRDIPKSPFEVKVEGFAGNASKVTASGPGLEPEGVVANRPTYFDIFTKDAGRGTPEVVVLDPNGQRNTVPVKIRQISPDVYRAEYMAVATGVHSVNVFFAGQPIPKSPFGVRVAPVSDARRVRASGRGLQPNGVRVKDVADFRVYTDGAGEGQLDIRVIGPGGVNEPVKLRKIDEHTTEAVYNPRKEGRHVVMITYGGHEIPKSPFEVNVGPYKETEIVVFGPGLHGGVVGQPALFTVETNGNNGALGFSIEGPSQAKIECHDNGDGTADVRYYPEAPGEYAVHILCDGEDIPKSPYMAQIVPKEKYHCQPDKVECYGPGLEKTGVLTAKPANFTIDARKSGDVSAPIDVSVMDVDYHAVPVNKAEKAKGLYECSYVPQRGVKHTVQVNQGGVAVKNSPFRVYVSAPTDASKVQVFGPGVERGVKSSHPTHFNVDAREAGPGDLAVTLTNDKGQQLPYELEDNGDGTYVIGYTPTSPGPLKVSVLYAGKVIPQSPITVQVQPHVDVSKVKVDGLEPIAPVHSVQQFRVYAPSSPAGPLPDIAVVISQPSGLKVAVRVAPFRDGNEHGYLVEFALAELGDHVIDIVFGGHVIRNSGGLPYRVRCVLPPNAAADRVKAYGPGLASGTAGRAAEFVIDTRGAGPGGLGVTVEGPSEAAIHCCDNGDGTCSVAYMPVTGGDYLINITFNGQPINRAPFVAKIDDNPASKVRAHGPGIQRDHAVFVESPAEFTVDSRAVPKKAGEAPGKVSAVVTNPSGTRMEPLVTPLADGQQRVAYTPFEEGPHKVDVLYDGIPVPGSPFPVNARRGCDPRKVKAFGPGLERGIVNQANVFTIETKGAGTGGLGLAIEGPSEAKMTCRDNRDGSCTVEYVPTEAGEYDISIKFADQSIPGSPFKVPVDRSVDVNAVRAYGPGLEPKNCRANIPQRFKIDASKSGKAPMAVDIRSDRGPLTQKPEVIDNGDGTYDVTYMPPPENSTCKVRVTYGGKDIPKSPFEMKVRPTVEPKNVKVTGPGVSSKGIPASIPADFTVDATDAGYGDLQVQVLGPDGHPRKVKVSDNGDGTFKAVYTPDDLGNYKINVKYGGKEVPHAPFTVQAHPTGKAEKCKITEGLQRTLAIGEEYCLSVNAQNAGTGAVTCRIRSTSGSDMDIDIEDNGDGTFSIYYTVKDAGEYTINIKFGGQPIPDGVYSFTAQGEEITKRKTSHSQFRQVELHNIPLPTTGGQVTGQVKMPSGKVDFPRIHDNRDGTVSIEYEPKEEGVHELEIRYNKEHVQGSPFKFFVDSVNQGLVTAYGPGLTHGVCGETCLFTISTEKAGSGGLSVAVEGPSKAEINCHDNKDGTVSVAYLPITPGEYKVSVKYAGNHIRGSPYTVKITGEGRKRNQISVGSASEVPLPGRVPDTDLRALNATIQAPSGLEEPCFLKLLPNGNLGISFTPREPGDHHVTVKRMGKQIAGSPFKIKVAEREVGDAKKVLVSGAALHEGKTHTDNTFNVDTRKAGFGGLSLSVEGPSKAEIKCKDNENGTLDISYRPTEPGYYIMNLKFADHHVEGSPFTIKVSGEGSNTQTERIHRNRDAVPQTEVGSKCHLAFKIPGVSAMDLTAFVTSPTGVTDDAEIAETEDGAYGVSFVPKVLGIHTVSVKYKEVHIPGSPFQFTVGPLKDAGAHRVHAGGPGLQRGEQGQPCEFNVWTREAGAGSLSISVEGPSKAEIDFKDRKDGSCYVVYKVSEPGEYRVGVKFNEHHIPDSPFRTYITPAQGDAHKIEVGQFPDSGCQTDKPQAFILRKNGAKGDFDCKVVGPSGSEDDCYTSAIDSDIYSVRFVPRENGLHHIHVKFNGVHIAGSPFILKVGKDDSDPACVHAAGPGLHKALTGRRTDFIINTCSAGTGTLATTIDGPSKVSMDCSEVEEGYKVHYTPLTPGDYFITVKYNGFHIPGSPFHVPATGDKLAEGGVQESSSVVVETTPKVASKKTTGVNLPSFTSDVTKVTSKGMGLKRAYINKQNTFSVAAADAGNNLLFVAIYGPKGPCEEVFVKHVGRNNYQVNYTVRDRGDYAIIVKWGEDHIPGSPFKVEV